MVKRFYRVLKKNALWDVFSVLRTKRYEEQHFSPFFSLKFQELKIFLDSVVLNQKKKSSFFSPCFLYIHIRRFAGAPFPSRQQCFWVGTLHTEIYSVLWEKAASHVSEKLEHSGLLLSTVNWTEILPDLILIKIWQTLATSSWQ